MLNYIKGIMSTNWSVKRICSAFSCSREFARMYLQPCSSADQVMDVVELKSAIDWSVN